MKNNMKEMNLEEMGMVNGGNWLTDLWKKVKDGADQVENAIDAIETIWNCFN